MKNIVLTVAACALVLVVSLAVRNDGGLFLDTDSSNNTGIGIVLALFYAVAMLVGILAGRIHSRLSNDESARPRDVLATVWSDRDLWKSLLASPIVFGVVHSLLAQTHDVVTAVVFSFQNGFFCNVILENKRTEITAKPGRDTATPT